MFMNKTFIKYLVSQLSVLDTFKRFLSVFFLSYPIIEVCVC